ncbi:hypothetical protein ACFSUS_14545 [Spirosoma soli]|uniref:Uncharacterized protein n=1 Tax=Spirosoma soli TaxID=1770529 RepID=A0ABW5M4C0_9BACT
MNRFTVFVVLVTACQTVYAQPRVPKADYAVYEAGLPTKSYGRDNRFYLLPKTVPIYRIKNLKIWYQPRLTPAELRNRRPPSDSLWIWEDTLQASEWRQLLLRFNTLDTSDTLLLDKTQFRVMPVYSWPTDAERHRQQTRDTIRSDDPLVLFQKLARFDAIPIEPYYNVLSQITYSPDGHTAMFYYAHYCGSRCGSGGLVFLKQVNGLWTHYYTHQIWIS